MALHGLAWPCMALYGLVWLCMVLCGLLWYCVAMSYTLWYYIAFSRGHRSKFIWSCSFQTAILDHLTPMDVRILIKAEEELDQARHFTRLFPSEKSHQYFKYFYEGIPYYDKLLDAWENAYGKKRRIGINRLRKECKRGIHI